jgi:polyphosphate:AMP phosphotransferase
MFEPFELGSKVAKAEYAEAVPDLRVRLLNAQFDLRKADFPVLILLAGDDYHGVDELLDILHEWLDARYIDTHVFLRPSEAERERPLFFRYWSALPRRGRIGIHVGAWAVGAVRDRVLGELSEAAERERIRHICRFERSLVDSGTLLLKVWVHLPPKEHKRRLQKNGKHSNGNGEHEDSRWIWENHDKAIEAAGDFLRKTDSAGAPWWIVEGSDERFRNLSVARPLADALEARLNERASLAPTRSIPAPPVPDVLGTVDLGANLEREEYRERLDALQERLRTLARDARAAQVSSVLVFEGWDAAGKGGCIRRITHPLEARDYRVVPIGAPNEVERAHHYLWRFWRQLPGAGRTVIFDRSWYGRVLVERVEQLAREEEWRRSYEEIRDFEEQVTEYGIAFAKFWLHIDAEEQLRRFQAREQTPYKKYKITDEDYRNRGRWDDYVAAVNEMVARTGTEAAPWHLIAANDKRYARVRVLEETCAALKAALERA